jgi:hypothetical protein
MTPREAHENREALIEAFLENWDIPERARTAIEEIIEADRIWAHVLLREHQARQLAEAGS